jgi:hypothetical protein
MTPWKCILDLCTRSRWVISFTRRSLYPRYPFDRRLGGPQSRSGRCGKQNNHFPLWRSSVSALYCANIEVGVHWPVYLVEKQAIPTPVHTWHPNIIHYPNIRKNSTHHNISDCVKSCVRSSACYLLHARVRITHSVWRRAMGWMTEVRFPSGGRFLFSTASKPALWPTQPHIQCVPEPLFSGVKRSGRETDHSPIQRRGQQYWRCTSTPTRLHSIVLN